MYMETMVIKGLMLPVRLLKVSASSTSAPVVFKAVDSGMVPMVMKITGLLIALMASRSLITPVRTRAIAPTQAGYQVFTLRMAQVMMPRIVAPKITAVSFS